MAQDHLVTVNQAVLNCVEMLSYAEIVRVDLEASMAPDPDGVAS
jgi:hypothetical protein